MLIGAAYLWRRRAQLCERELPLPNTEGKSSAILGATITAVELPTAFPYFAVIAAIVGSGLDPARQLGLLLLFNICFVAPLLGIISVLTFIPSHAEQVLGGARDWLQRHWPQLLAGLLLIAGVFVTALGVTGLSIPRSRFARLIHHLPTLLHK
jgi:cytochrome c biogenesis protein CcdA